MPTYFTIIEKLMQELDLILHDFIYNGYTSLAMHLSYPLGLAVTLYILLLGLAITQSWIEWSLTQLIKVCIKLSTIYLFALHWGIFSEWVVSGIVSSAGQIGDWLISATPMHLPQFAGTGINGALQSVLIEFTKIGAWIFIKGSWYTLGPLFTAIIIWVFGYILIMISVLDIVTAKIMLSVLFVVAPLFISFTLFTMTRQLFDRWLGAVIGFAFMMIFVSAAIGLALTLAQWAIVDTYATQAVHLSLVGFVGPMLVCFLGICLLFKVTQIAQILGSGISTISATGIWGGVVANTVTLSYRPVSKVFQYSAGVLKPAVSTLAEAGAFTVAQGASLFAAVHRRLTRGRHD